MYQICHKHMCCVSQVRSFSSRFEKTRNLFLPTNLVSTVFPFCFYISAGIVSICHRGGRWGTRSGFWQANNKPKNWTFLIWTKQKIFDQTSFKLCVIWSKLPSWRQQKILVKLDKTQAGRIGMNTIPAISGPRVLVKTIKRCSKHHRVQWTFSQSELGEHESWCYISSKKEMKKREKKRE